MKIICAGLQKTGTKSIAEALRILGYNVHDVYEQFFHEKELWDKILKNTVTTEDYQQSLEDVDAVMDWPAVAVWEQIMEAFPDAKVILTIRSSEDEWYESVKNQYEVGNQYAPKSELLMKIYQLLVGSVFRRFEKQTSVFLIACLGVQRFYGTPIEAFLRSRYRQHNLYVKSTCPSNKLLIYNVKDGWEPLCNFLNQEIPDKPFPRKNIKANMTHKLLANKWEHDCGLMEDLHRRFKIFLGTLVFLIIAIISYVGMRYFEN
uniref:uncharacterized protein LOC120334882 n=1 Tax=Styela clava TaxID=7725 RepID=UPI0019397975|nr:uncharacterized protein LOC120334882 [Styela clava]